MSSEEQLRAMIDAIPTLVWSAHPDGSAAFFNRRWLDYTGLSPEQALDGDWTTAFHPDDRDRVVGTWRSILASGKPSEIEARLRRFDGDYRWFLFRVSEVRGAAGDAIEWCGAGTDIDDRRRAEEATRARESDFRLILDTIPGLVSTRTSAGAVEFINQQTVDFFGASIRDLPDWSSLVHPDDRERVVTKWRRTVQSGLPLEIELRARRADGAYRWLESRFLPVRDAQDGIVRWYNLIIDIDDRKHAEEALRASERALSLIIDSIPGLVWGTSPDGAIPYANQRILDYVGASVTDLAGGNWANFVHPDDRESSRAAWLRAIATGGPYEVQYRVRRADGAYRWMHVLGQLGKDSGGCATRWYGLSIDIDDRKNMEEALRTAQARLSRATQITTIGELAASVAHEVNQPLAAVVANGYACLRWLAARPPNLVKAQEAAERIVRDGKDASEVVARIRALFKRTPLDRIALDLSEVIEEVIHVLRSETVRRGVAVTLDLEEGVPCVVGDRVQLQQLVLNLLLNGLEAMDPIVNLPKTLVVRSTRDSSETIRVEVTDSGVGLKDPDRVFEAFFTTKENGMGMGLAICRSIVEAHDGHLWAAPVNGPGTTFCFTLPLHRTANP